MTNIEFEQNKEVYESEVLTIGEATAVYVERETAGWLTVSMRMPGTEKWTPAKTMSKSEVGASITFVVAPGVYPMEVKLVSQKEVKVAGYQP